MQMLRIPDLKRIKGFKSHASIYQEIKHGLCTSGIALGPRARGWPSNEISILMSARIAGQTDDQIRLLVTRLHAKRLELPADFPHA